jgi:DNA-binding SARP family transcriptional activator
LEVVADERLRLGGRRQQAVLAVLLLHRGEAVASDRLIEAVWGGRPPARADKALHVYVSNLRKALGDGVLLTEGRGYLLAAESDQVDSERFEKLAAKGREALQEGDPDKARTWLQAALALWRGPPLTDFSYESFAQSEIARLEEVRVTALESRIEADLELGEHAAVVPELEALVHGHPLRERLYEQLMLALYRSGRQVDALERYQRARRKLLDEFGIEPGPRLKEIQQAVLNQDAALGEPERGAAMRRRRWPRARRRGSAASLRARQLVARVRGAGRIPSKARWPLVAAGALLVAAVVVLASTGGHSSARKRAVLVARAGISSPAPAGVYAQGQVVPTSFSCGAASPGPGLSSCNDSTGTETATGGRGRLDTSTPGPHRYIVAATLNGGASRTTSIAYTVIAPLSLAIESARATVAQGRVEIALACSGGTPGAACTGTLSLTGRHGEVASSGYSLPAGTASAVALALSRRGVLALKRAHSHELHVLAATTLSNAIAAERTITLKRRRA